MKQIRGVSYSKNDASLKFEEGLIPVLRAGNIQNSRIVHNDFVYIPKGGVKDTQLLRHGDILIAASSGSISIVGKAAMILEDINAGFGAFCKVLRPNAEIVNKDYFKFFFETPYYKNTISQLAEGANINNLKTEHFDNLEIPLPPLPQQQKIATILDTVDTLRQNDKALLAKYDELTQALFLDMFGDPVSNPKKWKVNKLKEISIKIHSGNTPKGGSEVYVEEGITFFRSQNVWKNRLVYEDIAFLDQATHDKMMKSSLKHKDILMTKTGRINTENSSLGRAAMYLGEDDEANVNGHVYLIRLKKGIINEFVLHILTTKEYRGHIRSVCVGGIDKRQLNKDHIENFPIINPPIELQNKFTEQLAIIEQQKAIIQKSLIKSEELFNSLLQKAFKGELV
ncbi:restriction endonuclease subunit S [Flavobacterium sp. WC2509]|uniref:restriction endonuclease subunit S n=1 Tax=Flavobacterium sp. WC2509 TaxID=3461406 RepID=UPI004045198C